MSKTLIFWRLAYRMTEEQFFEMDHDGVADMVTRLSDDDRVSLLVWLVDNAPGWTRH
ncbi:MAG: hypothetical protein JNL45_08050 [Hyphomicrobium sp.]|nr:hypothetical protein [Hyphomicrobium sp.]